MLRKDVLGNIIGILDREGKSIVKYKYDGWGNHVVLDGNGAKLTAENCTATNKVGILNPFRYRSYYYDTETGLYFLKTRYYDPEVGRFITIDDISYLAPDTINGLNLYAYCNNNPVMRTDSQGTSWWDNVKNWFRNTGRRVGNVLKAGAGILRIGGGLSVGSELSSSAIGVGVSLLSNAFGFDIDIDRIPDPSLKSKGILDTLREGWNGIKYFVKETVWDDWIVDKFGRGFLKEIVWDKGIVPAWDWVWNDALKWASQNPVINGIVAVGGLVLAIVGVVVSAPVIASVVTVAGIVLAAIGVILWIRSLFD